MRISTIKASYALFLSALFAFTIYSCKKNEAISNAGGPLTKEEAIRNFKKEMGNTPVITTYQVNLPGTGFYGDANGNKIDFKARKGQKLLYDCPDPADDYFSQSVVYVKSEYSCGQ